MKWTKNSLLLLVLSLCLSLLPVTTQAAVPSLVESEAVIYTLEDWAAEKLSIPDAYPQSFQIQVENAQEVSYGGIYYGDSVTVSDTGLVTPRVVTTYWYSDGGSYIYGTTVEDPDKECVKITNEYNYGISRIRVNADGVGLDMVVEVKDYADVYADQVIDAYIRDNFTVDMTLEEKLDAICRFPASYNYSASYSSATGMIVSGGGDCWASTDLIMELCGRLGLDAKIRNGNRDPGAGSGHINVLVHTGDGEYYQLDAGYSGTAPRYYSVTRRDSLFCFRSVSGGLEVYQYDGDITEDTVLTIPETFGGKPVVSIGDKFVSQTKVKEVIVPDGVTNIGEGAFNSCSNLESLRLPADLKEIGDFAFTGCTNLTNLEVDDDHPNFCSVDGVLYSKDMTLLVVAPACSEVTIPDTVQTIGYYAFYYNSNLKQLTIPATVQTLEEGAIAHCTGLERIIVEGTPAIGEFAFAESSSLKGISFVADAPTIAETAFYRVSTNVCYPGDNSTWTSDLLQDYYGTVNWVQGHSFAEGACIHCGTEDPDYLPPSGVLTGTLTTFDAGDATLTLTVQGDTTPVCTVSLADGLYRIDTLVPGEYVLTLSKAGHKTRTYPVTVVSGDNTMDLKLHRPGDINGDGKVNMGDVSRVFACSRGTGALTGYELACADATDDGKVNMGDVSKVFSHVRKRSSLW